LKPAFGQPTRHPPFQALNAQFLSPQRGLAALPTHDERSAHVSMNTNPREMRSISRGY